MAGSGSARETAGERWRRKRAGVGWEGAKAEAVLSAESNDTRRAGEDAIKVWS